MDIKGEQFIPMPRQQVWAALNDVEILKQAIPGCDSMARLSDTEIEATVTAKVGPVKATFKGQVTLADLDPPNSYSIRGEGKGGVAGFAKGGAKVRLADAEAGSTKLAYDVSAQVGGKIAQLGARLIDSTAKQLADQFCQLAGGPCVYDGETMKKAHASMHVARADFNALVEDLQDAMDARAIPFAVQRRLLALLAPMHRDIVEPR